MTAIPGLAHRKTMFTSTNAKRRMCDCEGSTQVVELTSKIAGPGELNETQQGLGFPLVVLTGAFAVLLAWTAVEFALWAMPVLPNKAPVFDLHAFGRSTVTLLLSVAVLLAFVSRTPVARNDPLSVRQAAIVTFSSVLLGVFVALFLMSPESFHEASLEDGPVEWASAILPIAASFLLALRGARLFWQGRGTNPWPGLALIFSAAVLFAIGMEEISWMQRILGFHTPEVLNGNIQHEANLHNLATNQIGTAHKFVGFVFLILLPFICATTPLATIMPSFSRLIPSRCVALASAPLAALNYNGWDFLPMQMTTYLTIGILLYFAYVAWSDRRPYEAFLCMGLMLVVIAAQILFVVLGDRFFRIWDVTEYKELIIALGLFVWAAEVSRQLAGAGVLRTPR